MFPTSTVVQLHPVVLPIFNFPCVLQGLSEEVSQIVIIGSVLETEVANVGQILVEFIWIAIAEIFNRSRLLLFSDFLVLLLVRSRL